MADHVFICSDFCKSFTSFFCTLSTTTTRTIFDVELSRTKTNFGQFLSIVYIGHKHHSFFYRHGQYLCFCCNEIAKCDDFLKIHTHLQGGS